MQFESDTDSISQSATRFNGALESNGTAFVTPLSFVEHLGLERLERRPLAPGIGVETGLLREIG